MQNSCACKVPIGRDPFGRQPFRNDVELLGRILSQYASYLNERNKQMKIAHDQLQPIQDVGDRPPYLCVFASIGDYVSTARSQSEIERIKQMLPSFKTRATRRAAFARFERLTPKLTSVAFNYMYKEADW